MEEKLNLIQYLINQLLIQNHKVLFKLDQTISLLLTSQINQDTPNTEMEQKSGQILQKLNTL